MSSVQARKLVLVSMFLLGIISVYRVKQGGSLYRRLWGVGVIGVALSVAADFVPQIAGPFAGLVLLGSLTNGGDQAIQNLLGTVGGGKAGGGAPAGPSVVNVTPTTHVAVIPGANGATTVQHITGP